MPRLRVAALSVVTLLLLLLCTETLAVDVDCTVSTNLCAALNTITTAGSYTFNLTGSTSCALACASGPVDWTNVASGSLEVTIVTDVVQTLTVGSNVNGTFLISPTSGIIFQTPAGMDVQFTRAQGLGLFAYSGPGTTWWDTIFRILGSMTVSGTGVSSFLHTANVNYNGINTEIIINTLTVSGADNFPLFGADVGGSYVLFGGARIATGGVASPLLALSTSTDALKIGDGVTLTVSGTHLETVLFSAANATSNAGIYYNCSGMGSVGTTNISLSGPNATLNVSNCNTTAYHLSGYNVSLYLATIGTSTFAMQIRSLVNEADFVARGGVDLELSLPVTVGRVDLSGPDFLGHAILTSESVASTIAYLNAVCTGALSSTTCNAGLDISSAVSISNTSGLHTYGALGLHGLVGACPSFSAATVRARTAWTIDYVGPFCSGQPIAFGDPSGADVGFVSTGTLTGVTSLYAYANTNGTLSATAIAGTTLRIGAAPGAGFTSLVSNNSQWAIFEANAANGQATSSITNSQFDTLAMANWGGIELSSSTINQLGEGAITSHDMTMTGGTIATILALSSNTTTHIATTNFVMQDGATIAPSSSTVLRASCSGACLLQSVQTAPLELLTTAASSTLTVQNMTTPRFRTIGGGQTGSLRGLHVSSTVEIGYPFGIDNPWAAMILESVTAPQQIFCTATSQNHTGVQTSRLNGTKATSVAVLGGIFDEIDYDEPDISALDLIFDLSIPVVINNFVHARTNALVTVGSAGLLETDLYLDAPQGVLNGTNTVGFTGTVHLTGAMEDFVADQLALDTTHSIFLKTDHEMGNLTVRRATATTTGGDLQMVPEPLWFGQITRNLFVDDCSVYDVTITQAGTTSITRMTGQRNNGSLFHWIRPGVGVGLILLDSTNVNLDVPAATGNVSIIGSGITPVHRGSVNTTGDIYVENINVVAVNPGDKFQLWGASITTLNMYADNADATPDRVAIDCYNVGPVQMTFSTPGVMDELEIGTTHRCGALAIAASGASFSTEIQALAGVQVDSMTLGGSALVVDSVLLDTIVNVTGAFNAGTGAFIGINPLQAGSFRLINCNPLFGNVTFLTNLNLTSGNSNGIGCAATFQTASDFTNNLYVGTATEPFGSIQVNSTLQVSPTTANVSLFVTSPSNSIIALTTDAGTKAQIGGIAADVASNCSSQAACSALLYVIRTDYMSDTGVSPRVTLVLDNSTQIPNNGTLVVDNSHRFVSDVRVTNLIVTATLPVTLINVIVDNVLTLNSTGVSITGTAVTATTLVCNGVPAVLSIAEFSLTGATSTICGDVISLTLVQTLATATMLDVSAGGTVLIQATDASTVLGATTFSVNCADAVGTVTLLNGVYGNIIYTNGSAVCASMNTNFTSTTALFAAFGANTTIAYGTLATLPYGGTATSLQMTGTTITAALKMTFTGTVILTNIVHLGTNTTLTCGVGASISVSLPSSAPDQPFVVNGACASISYLGPINVAALTLTTTAAGASITVDGSAGDVAALTLMAPPTNSTVVFLGATPVGSATFVAPVVVGGDVAITGLLIDATLLPTTIIQAGVALVLTTVGPDVTTGSTTFNVSIGGSASITQSLLDNVAFHPLGATTVYSTVTISSSTLVTVLNDNQVPAQFWSLSDVIIAAQASTLALWVRNSGNVFVSSSVQSAGWSNNITVLPAPGATCGGVTLINMTVNNYDLGVCGVAFTDVIFTIQPGGRTFNSTRAIELSGVTFFQPITIATVSGANIAITDVTCNSTVAVTGGGAIFANGLNAPTFLSSSTTGSITMSNSVVPTISISLTAANGLNEFITLTNVVSTNQVNLTALPSQTVRINNPVFRDLRIVGGSVVVDGQGGNTIALLQVNCGSGSFSLIDETVTQLDYVINCSTIAFSAANVSDKATSVGTLQASVSVAIANASAFCNVSRAGCGLLIDSPAFYVIASTVGGPITSVINYTLVHFERCTLTSFTGASRGIEYIDLPAPIAVPTIAPCNVTYIRIASTVAQNYDCAYVTIRNSTFTTVQTTAAQGLTLELATVAVLAASVANNVSIVTTTVADIDVAEDQWLLDGGASGTIYVYRSTFFAAAIARGINAMFSSNYLGDGSFLNSTFYAAPDTTAAPLKPVFSKADTSIAKLQFLKAIADTAEVGSVSFPLGTRLGFCGDVTTCTTAHYWGASSGPFSLGGLATTCGGLGVAVYGSQLTMDYIYISRQLIVPTAFSCIGALTTVVPVQTTSALTPTQQALIVAGVAVGAVAAVGIVAVGIGLGVSQAASASASSAASAAAAAVPKVPFAAANRRTPTSLTSESRSSQRRYPHVHHY